MQACWQILTFEIGGTSIILRFVFANGQYELLPIIPFLILVSSLIHLSETSAIINAGDYIRDYIEVDLQEFRNLSTKSMSWESFVRDKGKSDPYKLIHISVFCLFAGMFWVSITLTVLLRGQNGFHLTTDWLLLLVVGYALAFSFYSITWHKQVFKKLRIKAHKQHRKSVSLPDYSI